MADQSSIVVPMREEHLERAAGVMARAFQDDPLFVAMFPDPVERTRVMPAVAAWNFRHALLFGTALVAGNDLTGVAILYRGEEPLFTEAHLATSLGALPEQLGAAAWERYERMQATWTLPEERLAAAVPEPHWYLDVVGVDPARQGAGVGSALLRAIHERADRHGWPTALFTVQPRNVPFYERHGYELVAEGTEPIAGLRYLTGQRGYHSLSIGIRTDQQCEDSCDKVSHDPHLPRAAQDDRANHGFFNRLGRTCDGSASLVDGTALATDDGSLICSVV